LYQECGAVRAYLVRYIRHSSALGQVIEWHATAGWWQVGQAARDDFAEESS